MVSSRTLPADLEALVRDEIAPGERVVYAEQPKAGRAVLGGFAAWLFAVPWTAFSVFWTVMAASGVESWFSVQVAFPLFGTPFVAIGLAMLSAPWWAWRHARHSLCVVTDRRAVLFEAQTFRAIGVRTFGPEALRDTRRVERPDGSGDLLFATVRSRDSDGDVSTSTVGFKNVADVRAAEAAVFGLTEALPERDAASAVPRRLERA